MELYKIVIIVIVIYIILYNLTYGFSLFNKKRTVIIYDVEVEELQNLNFYSVINKYPSTSINIDYDTAKRTATIQDAFDLLLISGIQGTARVQIDSTIFADIRDAIIFSVFKAVDISLEGDFVRQEIESIHENTNFIFPEKQNVFRLRETGEDEYNYVFKSKNIKELNLIILT